MDTVSANTDSSARQPQSDAVTVEPGPFDVKLGRGKGNRTHSGNQRFAIAVNMQRQGYHATSSRAVKTQIAKDVVNSIQTGSRSGRFLRFSSEAGGWLEVDNNTARTKVSQALRYKPRTSLATSKSAMPRRENLDTEPQAEQKQETGVAEGESSSSPGPSSSNFTGSQWSNSPDVEPSEPLVSDQDILAQLGYATSEIQQGSDVNLSNPDIESTDREDERADSR